MDPVLKTYTVTATGERSACETRTDTGFIIRSDTPLKMGGENAAPQPVELLLAALIGCEQGRCFQYNGVWIYV